MNAYLLNTLDDLEPGDHLCCLYGTDAERRATLASFIGQGLSRGEKVLFIQDDPSDRDLLQDLETEGVDLEAHLSSGQLYLLDIGQAYLQEGVFDPQRMIEMLQAETRRALAEGYRALRVTGGTAWAQQGRPGSERLIEYEAGLSAFFPGSQCLALCQYDRRNFDPALLLDVLAAHPILLIEGEFYDNIYHVPPAELFHSDIPQATLQHWLENLAARKQTEERLRQQAQIIDQIHDSVVSTDLEGYITSWNKGAERLFEYPAQEAIGQHISLVYPPDQHQFLQRKVIAPLKERGVHEVEAQMQKKSGERFYAHLSLSLLKDHRGVVTGMIGYSADITGRKRMEQELQENTRRLANILESLTDAFYTLDHQWRFSYLNPRALQVLGHTRDELAGQSVWEAFPDLVGTHFYIAFHQAVSDQRPIEFEIFYPPFDGWYEVRAYPYQDGLSVFVNDITGRKRAEAELKTRSRQQAVMTALGQRALAGEDIDTLMDEIVSQVAQTLEVEFCKILELLPGEQALLLKTGVGWKDAAVGRVRINARTDSQAGYTLLSSQPVIVEDLRTETRFRGPPLLLEHGVVSGMSVIIQGPEKPFGILGAHTAQQRKFTQDDINFLQSVSNVLGMAIQRTRLFDQLRAANEQLRQLSRQVVAAQESERQRVSRELHDEAGQALTALKISLDLLQADLPAEPASLRRSIQEAKQLTNRTMEHIRLLAHALRPPELDALGLDPVLEELCRDFARRTHMAVEYSGIALPDLPNSVAIAFYRMLQETLTNVAKHAQASQVQVTLQCDERDIRLSVEDDGQGFAGSPELPASPEGAGIGLLGIRERFKLLGGGLEIASIPGTGTRLLAYVPRRSTA